MERATTLPTTDQTTEAPIPSQSTGVEGMPNPHADAIAVAEQNAAELAAARKAENDALDARIAAMGEHATDAREARQRQEIRNATERARYETELDNNPNLRRAHREVAVRDAGEAAYRQTMDEGLADMEARVAAAGGRYPGGVDRTHGVAARERAIQAAATDARANAEASATRGFEFQDARAAGNWEEAKLIMDEAQVQARATGNWAELDGYFDQLSEGERDSYTKYYDRMVDEQARRNARGPVDDPTDSTNNPPKGTVYGSNPPQNEDTPGGSNNTDPANGTDPAGHNQPPAAGAGAAEQDNPAPAERELSSDIMKAIQKVAAARKALKMSADPDEKEKLTKAVEKAMKRLDNLILADPETTKEGEKLALKARTSRVMTEMEVDMSENAKRSHALLARIGNSPIVKGLVKHKKLVYGVATAAALAIATASVIASGGSTLPVVVAALAARAARGTALGLAAGHIMGGVTAKMRRFQENTKQATSEHNHDLRADLAGVQAMTWSEFVKQSNKLILEQATGMHDANVENAKKMRRSGRLNGALGGMAMGLLWGAVGLDSITHATGAGGAEQTAGITHVNDPSTWGNLSQQAAGNGKGQTLWEITQNNGGKPLSSAATEKHILDGMSKVHDAGVQVKSHGAVGWDPKAHHYVTNGDQWYFGNKNSVVVPQGKTIYAVGVEGNKVHIDSFQGSLNNGQQDALLDLANDKHVTLMDQAHFDQYMAANPQATGAGSAGEAVGKAAAIAAKAVGGTGGAADVAANAASSVVTKSDALLNVATDPMGYAAEIAGGVLASGLVNSTKIPEDINAADERDERREANAQQRAANRERKAQAAAQAQAQRAQLAEQNAQAEAAARAANAQLAQEHQRIYNDVWGQYHNELLRQLGMAEYNAGNRVRRFAILEEVIAANKEAIDKLTPREQGELAERLREEGRFSANTVYAAFTRANGTGGSTQVPAQRSQTPTQDSQELDYDGVRRH